MSQREEIGGKDLSGEERARQEQLAILRKIGRRPDFHVDEFGENVYFFSPADACGAVQEILDRLWYAQEKNQFGKERYAIYFLPGDYSEEIAVRVGFYMQVAGLGYLPGKTRLKSLHCNARWLGGGGNYNATCNFWRGVENLYVDSDMMWAVSQATFLRRVHITGNLFLHDRNGWASGGFLADSLIEGMVDSGSQQQWLSRNCAWDGWRGSNWNIVFAGIEEGKAPKETWPQKQYTVIPAVDEIQEKPFLIYDGEKGFGIFLPEFRKDAASISWKEAWEQGGLPRGKFLPMDLFYVARADRDNAASLNAALREGKHLFFTPGIYELEEELLLDRAGSIVLGTGLATLRPMNGNLCMRAIVPQTGMADEAAAVGISAAVETGMADKVAAVEAGVTGEAAATMGKSSVMVAGLIFDAGEKKSPLLLQVSNSTKERNIVRDAITSEDTVALKDTIASEDTATTSKDTVALKDAIASGKNEASNVLPTGLSDLFFRVGGAWDVPTAVQTCVKIDADHVVGDHFWVWRADHGSQVGWTKNIAENGLVVNGDHVTIYALMAEHFQKYQTLWNGNGGKVIMYQSETPYDMPAKKESQDVPESVGVASCDAPDSKKESQDMPESVELASCDAPAKKESQDMPGSVKGFPSYKIASTVESHEAWGIGVYSYNRDAAVEIPNAMEVPEKPGIKISHVITVMLAGHPGICHVINNLGEPCSTPGAKATILEPRWKI